MQKISFALLSLSLTLAPVAGAADIGIQVMVDGRSMHFADVSASAWYANTVRAAAEAGIVSGYRDANGNLEGLFGPGNTITLAESLKVASEGAGYDESVYGASVDASVGSHWASPYVAVAKGETFAVVPTRTQLDRFATRAEVAALIASAFRVDTETPAGNRYDDVSVSTEHAFAIEALSRDGVVTGDTDANGRATGTFRPHDRINRAEVAAMVMRARNAYGMPGGGRSPGTDVVSQEDAVVTYTADGFSPAVLRIREGTTVTFRNETSSLMWVASNSHPAHLELPSFDQLSGVAQGGIYTYTFTRVGTWGYHNHLASQMGGTIIVEAEGAL